jgi:cytidine deaminase
MSVKSKLSAEERKRLISGAFEAREAAYAPYSNFRVGAAFLSEGGEIIQGCNIENASYGGTICAERTAMVKAVSQGIKKFVGLAVTTDVKSAISPCGICRQFIREFCYLDMPILMVPANYSHDQPDGDADGSGKIEEFTLGDLLPHSFGPEDLERPRGLEKQA